MNYKNLNKDNTIKSTVTYFADKFGSDTFKIKDHWNADLHAIGLTDISAKYLIYFSTLGKPENYFYVSLENPSHENIDHPYQPAGDFEHVSLEELENLFIRHLRIKARGAQHNA
jgi:hypothetical protein